MKWLRPDAKSQVSVQYVNDQPVRITNIVVSTQHAPDVKHKTIKDFIIEEVIRKVLPGQMLDKSTKFLINPTGRFVVGRSAGRHRSDGPKDYRGQLRRHGPSRRRRVQRQGPARRWIAAPLTWAVTWPRTSSPPASPPAPKFSSPTPSVIPDPVCVCVNTFGTGKVSDEAIEKAVCEVFSFKPADIIKQLNLLRPIYSKTTNYGHFGKVDDLDSITWEKTDKAAALKRAVK